MSQAWDCPVTIQARNCLGSIYIVADTTWWSSLPPHITRPDMRPTSTTPCLQLRFFRSYQKPVLSPSSGKLICIHILPHDTPTKQCFRMGHGGLPIISDILAGVSRSLSPYVGSQCANIIGLEWACY